jgi:hypothetical protein
MKLGSQESMARALEVWPIAVKVIELGVGEHVAASAAEGELSI